MRIDLGTNPDRPDEPSTDRPETARTGFRGVSIAVLALLIAGTSWAVASWVSAWLVLPYLILMALILSPSAARPQGEPDEEASDDPTRQSAQPIDGSDDPEPASDTPASAEGSEAGSEQGTSATPTKGRRGKGRARKAKPLPEVPTEATWVQVAPGKFVRVEGPDNPAEAGPHEPVGVPVEVPVTPQASEVERGANPRRRARRGGRARHRPRRMAGR